MTLYTYAKDPPNASACVAGVRRKTSPPAHSHRRNAKAYGDWVAVIRRLWTVRRPGRPCRASRSIRTVRDLDPGSSVGGNDPARFGARRKNRAGEYVGGGVRGSLLDDAAADQALPADWKPALLKPVVSSTR